MLVPRNVPIVDQVALRSIQVAVNAFIHKYSLPKSDREDLIQDVSLHLIQQAQNFNPSVGAWSTFVKCVVRSKFATIRRSSRTRKHRKQSRTVSLNQKTRDKDGRTAEMGDLIEPGASTAKKLRKIRTAQSLSELKTDVHTVVGRMKPELNSICQELLADRSLTEVSEVLHLSRSTTYRRLEIIHETLIEQELHRYL